MPRSTLNSLRDCCRSVAIAAWASVSIEADGKCLCCSVIGKCQFVVDNSKIMLKILQISLQQYMNQELPEVQAEFRKHRETRDQFANNSWDHRESEGSPEKKILLLQ